MSLSTTVGLGPYSTVVMPTVGIGPRGAPGADGPGAVLLGDYDNGLMPVRFVGVADHAGPPTAGDGSFLANDIAYDNTGQQWLCVADGTPGNWLAIGSGKILGQAVLATNFSFTAPALTDSDLPGMVVPWVYDGRPVRGVVTGIPCSQSQASVKQITARIMRSTDNAIVHQSARQTTTSGIESQEIHVDTGALTSYPSDGAPFVVGNTYTWKLNVQSGSTGTTSIWAGIAGNPVRFYVITC